MNKTQSTPLQGMGVKKLLFVCIENSNRSQMSQAFAKMLGGKNVEAFSAGSNGFWIYNAAGFTACAKSFHIFTTQHFCKCLAHLRAVAVFDADKKQFFYPHPLTGS